MPWATQSTGFQSMGGAVSIQDANDNWYVEIWNGRRLYWGTGGDPNGTLTCNLAGDLCWDDTTFKYYTASTDAATTWVVVN